MKHTITESGIESKAKEYASFHGVEGSDNCIKEYNQPLTP
jgi:hypothetical protein